MSPIRLTLHSADALVSKALGAAASGRILSGSRRGFAVRPATGDSASLGAHRSRANAAGAGPPGVVVTLSPEALHVSRESRAPENALQDPPPADRAVAAEAGGRIPGTARRQLHAHAQVRQASGQPDAVTGTAAGDAAGAGLTAHALLYGPSGGQLVRTSTEEDPRGTILNVRV